MRKSPTMSLLGVAFLTWRRHLESGVRQYGVTLKQQYLLRKLAEEGSLHPSEIADMLFCDRPTATVIINNMSKYGWIVSKKDWIDGRQRIVRITESGREKLKELQGSLKETIDPLACFSDEERNEFDRLLNKLHDYFKTCGL